MKTTTEAPPAETPEDRVERITTSLAAKRADLRALGEIANTRGAAADLLAGKPDDSSAALARVAMREQLATQILGLGELLVEAERDVIVERSRALEPQLVEAKLAFTKSAAEWAALQARIGSAGEKAHSDQLRVHHLTTAIHHRGQMLEEFERNRARAILAECEEAVRA